MWLYLFYFLACFCCVEVSELVSVTHLVFDAWAHTHTHTHTSPTLLSISQEERERASFFFSSHVLAQQTRRIWRRETKKNIIDCDVYVCLYVYIAVLKAANTKREDLFFFFRLLCCLVVFFFLVLYLHRYCSTIVIIIITTTPMITSLLAVKRNSPTRGRKKKKRNAGLLKLPHFLESRFETWDLIVALKKLTRWRKCGFPDLVHIRSLSFFLFGQFLNSHCGGGLTVLL